MSQPQIIAGACGYGLWPTNSLEGALACLDAPVAGIEIDVHLTADGHVVAHHDYRIAADSSRLNGAFLEAPGPLLRDATLAELQAYDLGRVREGGSYARRYPHKRGMDGVVMPTLPRLLQALAAAPGPRRWIFVEIKTDPADYRESADPVALTDAVLRDLDAADWADRAKIIAFDWSVLRDLKARRPEIATAHLTVPDAMKPKVVALANGDSPWTDGSDPRHFGGSELRAILAHGGREWSPHISDVTAERVAEAKALGLATGVWGVSTSEEIVAMSALGVEALTVSGPAWSA
ncbi:glycerophosphodiester phosphodiesterase family protein [Phenylobacterium aquaticum]|uniref:glycerophosphodiester phosphodiesterase family protein n=1 Tax=Phenylobacterium aquaticum TaxID=1763816 RepID=UPI0026F2ACAA|nr:glycerophosphodiester phosphodiesterase family protein [Phenylobacterium aquaticum]